MGRSFSLTSASFLQVSSETRRWQHSHRHRLPAPAAACSLCGCVASACAPGSGWCLSGTPVKIHRYLRTLCPVSLTHCIPSTGPGRQSTPAKCHCDGDHSFPSVTLLPSFSLYYCQYFGKNIKQTKSTAFMEGMYCQRKTGKSLQQNITNK